MVSSKVSNSSQGQPEGYLFISYYTEVLGRALLPYPGLFHCILCLFLIMLSVKQGGTKYHF